MSLETVVIPVENKTETQEQQQALLDRAEGKKPEATEQLLAGKFKTVEDLQKSYLELEKRFHAGEHKNPPAETPPAGEAPAGEKPPEKPTDLEVKQEEAKEAVEKAGLSFDKYAQTLADNGELADEDFAELEKAGFSRSMVNTYIAGIKAEQTNVVNAMLSKTGGADNYKAMIQWAGQNLSKEEVAEFNAALKTEARNLAVEGLYSRYQNAVGREGNLVTGKAATGLTGFSSRNEMKTAMSDPRYMKDREYTQEVERRVAMSSF